jgi:hypothetical protein
MSKYADADARPVHSSTGLDALAALASSMEESSTTYIASSNSSSCASDEDDTDIMPPPPPRSRGRLRSCSNPEGMEKWDSLSRNTGRRRYVLPTSILEEKLAEAKVAVDKKNDDDRLLIQRSRSNSVSSLPNEDESRVEPDELLRRARSRLLEDLSEGSITGEKGQLTLPHALSKYKHVSCLIAGAVPLSYFICAYNPRPFFSNAGL